MKAKVKATGQIVALDPRCNVTEIVKGGHPRMWTLAELELEDAPDYWTCLEHQAAIAAMQGILSNHNLYGSIIQITQVSRVAIDYAQELVEKMKEGRK